MPDTPDQPRPGWIRTFCSAALLRIGAVLVLIFVAPILVAMCLGHDDALGPGLLLLCCGKPALGVFALGLIEGTYLVVQRARGRRA